MKIPRKSLVAIPILVFILACQTVTRPFEEAKDTVGTAAAIATQAGEFVTQASGLATEVAPIETLMANPSLVPDFPSGNPLDPQSKPLSEWKGIPIMPQASAGDESDGMYVFKVNALAKEIEEFYATRLGDLGWETTFTMPIEGTAILVYSKGSQVLSITIMSSDGEETIVMLNLQ